MIYDTLIKNATVIDGTAADRFHADIAITADRVAKIGINLDLQAKQVFDAKGLIVAPGFIDAHTHDDRMLLSSPQMKPKVSQGVTTVIGGNCGISLAPLQGIEPPAPLNLLGDQQWYRFDSVKTYRSELESAGVATNCAMLVGHSTLRAGAMKQLNQPATADEVDQMKQAMSDSLESGCIGLSTGLAYPTARAAPTEEVLALAKLLPEYNGLYATHLRDESEFLIEAVDEAIRIGAVSGAATVISHHKTSGKPFWGKTRTTLEMIKKAKQHQTIHFDVYPYIASSSILLMEFVEVAEKVKITWSEPYPEMGGRYLDQICQHWSCDMQTAIEKLNPAGAVYFEIDEDELQSLMRYPLAMIGSDGLPHDQNPHPRLWGTFPRVVGYYARELGLFSVEQAIHQMTGLTASVFGLDQRGVIKQGNYADLVIFDEHKIIDLASFDESEQPSAGIERVYVNGQVVWRDGEVTTNRPGSWLERGL